MNKNVIHTSFGTLSYLEVNPGQSTTIFFIHGNSGSGSCWRHQFNSPLLSKYRMIAIDLPGHGNSDWANEPAKTYSPTGMAQILAEAIHKLQPAGSFSFVGWSYGANLIGELLALDIIPSGIAFVAPSIIGSSVTLDTMLIDPEKSIYFKTGLSRNEVIDFLGGQMDKDAEMFNTIVDDYMNTDLNFRPTLFQHAIEKNYSDELAMLNNFKGPVLVVFGTNDKIVNPDYLDNQKLDFWKGQVFKLENEGHFMAFENSATFNRLLAEYLGELNNTVSDSKS